MAQLVVLRDCFAKNYLYKAGTIIEYDEVLAGMVKNFASAEKDPVVAVKANEDEMALSQMGERPVVLQPDGIDRASYFELKTMAQKYGLKFARGNPPREQLTSAIRAAEMKA